MISFVRAFSKILFPNPLESMTELQYHDKWCYLKLLNWKHFTSYFLLSFALKVKMSDKDAFHFLLESIENKLIIKIKPLSLKYCGRVSVMHWNFLRVKLTLKFYSISPLLLFHVIKSLQFITHCFNWTNRNWK